jgi:hypothetical protein
MCSLSYQHLSPWGRCSRCDHLERLDGGKGMWNGVGQSKPTYVDSSIVVSKERLENALPTDH